MSTYRHLHPQSHTHLSSFISTLCSVNPAGLLGSAFTGGLWGLRRRFIDMAVAFKFHPEAEIAVAWLIGEERCVPVDVIEDGGDVHIRSSD